MNQTTNTICCCKKHLSSIKDKYIVLSPCYHIFHDKCFNSYKRKYCPICKSKIEKTLYEDYIKSNITGNKINMQLGIDILALKPFDFHTNINYGQFLFNLPLLINKLGYIYNLKNGEECHQLNKQILTELGLKIKVTGNKISQNKIVFICNHSSFLDPLIVYHLTKSKFLGSTIALKGNSLGEKIIKYGPLIAFERGKEKVMDRLIKYVNENNDSITIFPEGMITHPKTLGNFRTGAFNLGLSVQPIIIEYEKVISGYSLHDFILKLTSQKEINVNVTVLPVFYPPFSEDKINNIRKIMAKKGNLFMSRISNRDIKD